MEKNIMNTKKEYASNQSKERCWDFFNALNHRLKTRILVTGILYFVIGNLRRHPQMSEILDYIFEDDLEKSNHNRVG